MTEALQALIADWDRVGCAKAKEAEDAWVVGYRHGKKIAAQELRAALATPAPAQPEPKGTTPEGEVTTPGQSHQPEPMGEPVAWAAEAEDGSVQWGKGWSFSPVKSFQCVLPLYLHPSRSARAAAPLDAAEIWALAQALPGEGFGAAIERIEAHLRAAAPVEGAAWQDIETAPKDGSEIWGYCISASVVALKWTEQSQYYGRPGWEDRESNVEWQPTHWMPAVAAPKEKP